MKLMLSGIVAVTAACSPAGTVPPSPDDTTTSPGARSRSPLFQPLHTLRALRQGYSDAVSTLPVPVRRGGRVHLAVLLRPAYIVQPSTPEERRKVNEVRAPGGIAYVDPIDGERTYFHPFTQAPSHSPLDIGSPADVEKYFGIPAPAGGVIGMYDDAHALPKDRVETLRERILSALDVLLPFFTDDTRPWTEQATKAAQEVRDFFPLAAEPGLWPYYRAEGKDFFSWVEKNAPAAKAPLPW